MKLLNAIALMVTLAVSSSESVAAQTTSGNLIGVWGAERNFSTNIQGKLHIYERNGALEASIAGHQVPVIVSKNKLTFALPRNQGSYRGTFSKDRTRVEGHWIQARGAIDDYQFATPTDLISVPNAGWHGKLNPYVEKSSLYLRIAKEPDGSLSALLRNPERNVGVIVGVDHVALEGDNVNFFNSDEEIVLTGSLHVNADDAAHDVLSVVLFGTNSYDFTRRSRDNAPGFYPRPDQTIYKYSAPVANADGWAIARASSVGLQEDKLAEFVQNILDTETNSHRTPYIQDVVMARHGKLILDEHFYGYHADLPHDSRSAGKSITSMAVGAAVAEGAIELQTKVYSIFPESRQNPDRKKSDMTVEHLLTMTSGYACDDNDSDSPGNEGNMQYQGGQSNWLKFTLDLPMARAPGATGVYCTGGINLLAGIISQTTGEWFPDYFRSRLAKPLGIDHYHMNLDPMQQGYGGGGLRLRPRDFLKFGQTMLDDGVWNKMRVLPRTWVRASLTPHSSVNSKDDYGYAWWRSIHDANGQPFESWSATGNGGQLIIIVPKYDLVMAFNGGNYNNFPTWIAWRDKLMPALIAAAIK